MKKLPKDICDDFPEVETDILYCNSCGSRMFFSDLIEALPMIEAPDYSKLNFVCQYCGYLHKFDVNISYNNVTININIGSLPSN